jgi:low affinity Fe/Cu permease
VFSEENWGPATRNYLVSIKNLRTETLQKIIAQAQTYAERAGGRCVADSAATGNIADKRAFLIERD